MSCHRRRASSLAIVLPILSLLVLAPAAPVLAAPGDMTLVSTNAAGERAEVGIRDFQAADDGSVIVFGSESTNLGYGAIGMQVYAKDLATGSVVLASATAGGTPANGGPGVFGTPWFNISRNGRFVAFTSIATNLSASDPDANADLYVKDLVTGQLRLASTNAGGVKGNQTILTSPAISDDGQTVVFFSNASNFDPAHQSYACPPRPNRPPATCVDSEAYAKRLDSGALTLLTPVVTHFGPTFSHLDLSADGSTVAIDTNEVLVPSDTDVNGFDIYVRDLDDGSVRLASTASPAGTPDALNLHAEYPRLSADGSRVAFHANGAPGEMSAWDPRDTASVGPQVYLKDLASSALTLISVSNGGTIANDMSLVPGISADGTQVTFSTASNNIDPNDTDTYQDVYLRDLTAGTTSLISIRSDGVKADAHSQFAKPVPARDSVFITTLVDLIAFTSDLYERSAPYGMVDPDADGDGVTDDVDADGGAGTSAAGAFSDDTGGGLTTSGQIVDGGGLSVAIADAPDPDGVEITVGAGAGHVRLSVCGGSTVDVDAGSQAIITCGSVTVRVVTGQATVVLDGGATKVTVPAGGVAKVTVTGATFSVANLGSVPVSVVVDGVTGTIPAGQTRTVAPWDFVGYSQPVDNLPVMNTVIAGQAIPLKWQVLDRNGAPVTNLTTATITISTFDCALGTTVDQIEETVAGESGLLNKGNGNYQLNWKAPKTYAGSCKVLHLNINDGVTHDANFQFKK